MDRLINCSTFWGSAHIHDDDPTVEIIRDGFFLPLTSVQSHSWGLFKESGEPVLAAVDFREGSILHPSQTLSTTMTSANLGRHAPAGTYIYGGRIHGHFGHFLINTLPRFWGIVQARTPSTPILCHGPGTPADWFAIPFIAAAFGLLGLSPRDFVTFDCPTRLRSVVVPSTSLQEQWAGHRAYSRLCRGIGERICATASVDSSDRPIYYSKSRLTTSVGTITNESEIDDTLSAAGIDIVYPETLSFADQIVLMTSRKHILGSSGSFLHTSIFCPPRHITCLNVIEKINTNFVIVDKLAHNQATYHYPPAMQVLDHRPGFLTARYLPDAARVARDLLAILREGQAAAAGRPGETP